MPLWLPYTGTAPILDGPRDRHLYSQYYSLHCWLEAWPTEGLTKRCSERAPRFSAQPFYEIHESPFRSARAFGARR